MVVWVLVDLVAPRLPSGGGHTLRFFHRVKNAENEHDHLRAITYAFSTLVTLSLRVGTPSGACWLHGSRQLEREEGLRRENACSCPHPDYTRTALWVSPVSLREAYDDPLETIPASSSILAAQLSQSVFRGPELRHQHHRPYARRRRGDCWLLGRRCGARKTALAHTLLLWNLSQQQQLARPSKLRFVLALAVRLRPVASPSGLRSTAASPSHPLAVSLPIRMQMAFSPEQRATPHGFHLCRVVSAGPNKHRHSVVARRKTASGFTGGFGEDARLISMRPAEPTLLSPAWGQARLLTSSDEEVAKRSAAMLPSVTQSIPSPVTPKMRPSRVSGQEAHPGARCAGPDAVPKSDSSPPRGGSWKRLLWRWPRRAVLLLSVIQPIPSPVTPKTGPSSIGLAQGSRKCPGRGIWPGSAPRRKVCWARYGVKSASSPPRGDPGNIFSSEEVAKRSAATLPSASSQDNNARRHPTSHVHKMAQKEGFRSLDDRGDCRGRTPPLDGGLLNQTRDPNPPLRLPVTGPGNVSSEDG
ncbi:hypothetical protein K491DRAFT_679174 [Lophiostoma macrostomum CBS 122681]|uniref:Uncharacterized protein n=1 Tax=Lophiostoma macrostomum CBS 122681 TaxID=1314788 RepID=A0A6A6T5Y8_9PLEO|nr:hypothetical protein K491DRAFT_679174 [Lophiostoma macrostomum CBS 122681]